LGGKAGFGSPPEKKVNSTKNPPFGFWVGAGKAGKQKRKAKPPACGGGGESTEANMIRLKRLHLPKTVKGGGLEKSAGKNRKNPFWGCFFFGSGGMDKEDSDEGGVVWEG